MIPASNGTAMTFDIKKVSEITLKLYATTGIIRICAENVTASMFAILL